MKSVSEPTIPKSLDKAMEQKKNGHTAPPGISIRNGPVTEDAMDVDDEPIATGKRKSRGSTGKAVNYNEVPSASEDEKPIVSHCHQNHTLISPTDNYIVTQEAKDSGQQEEGRLRIRQRRTNIETQNSWKASSEHQGHR